MKIINFLVTCGAIVLIVCIASVLFLVDIVVELCQNSK
jgi:hypothetical protein